MYVVKPQLPGLLRQYFDDDGLLHNESGAACIRDYGLGSTVIYEEFWIHGKRRLDRSSLVIMRKDPYTKQSEIYLNQSNKVHREDGPATVEYYVDGSICTETYNQDDRLHRLDGPAWISYSETGKIYYKYYYFNGAMKPSYVDEDDWKYYANLQIYK